MKIKIKKIANVQTGYSFRSRIETFKGDEIAVIQMKDLLDDNTVSCNALTRISMEDMKDHHFAQKGDLVFRSRGALSTSALLLKYPGKAVVAAPLLRIRVTKSNKILPEYLNWYISQREAQIFLTSRAKGTVQKMISKQTIEDLEVVVPTLAKQQKIVELAKLSAREKSLLNTLADKKELYISTILMQWATKNEK